MKRFAYAICLIMAVCFVPSCLKDPNPEEPEGYVTLSIDVSVDTTAITTKTSMDGGNGQVRWSSTDTLTVYFVGKTISPAVTGTPQNIRNDGQTATFYYSVLQSKAMEAKFSAKYVVYGKQNIKLDDDKKPMSISLPSTQEYAGDKCFADGENTSIGYLKAGAFDPESGEVYKKPDSVCVMKNIFGILKVNISLSDAKNIDYIQLTDNLDSNYLAGEFVFTKLPGSAVADSVPLISHKRGTGGESLSIIKKVSEGNVTGGDFYFLVPPGTLFSSKGFNLYVYTTDGYYAGKRIKLSATGQASIERSVVTNVPVSPFKPKPVPTPLPLTANSYIVPAVAGPYSIPAHFKGNGYQGNRNTQFQSDVNTFPAFSYPIEGGKSAEIIWQGRLNGDGILDGEVVTKALYYTKDTLGISNYGFISFHRSGVEGDALVAVKDDSGNILWSWHLWVVDTADVTKLNSGETMYQQQTHQPIVTVMDRNIGALSALPDAYSQSHGLAYQYGRKDPYMGTRFSGPNTTATGYESFATIYPGTGIYCVTNTISLGQSILAPNVRSVPANGYWCESLTYWGNPSGDASKDSPKTLYDPCPAGWRTFEEKNLAMVLGIDESSKIVRPSGEVVASGEGYAFKLNNVDSSGVSHPVYFPGSGYSVSTTEVTQIGTVAGFWGANYVSNQASSLPSQATYIKIAMSGLGSSANAYTSDIPHADLFTSMPVRCQKWNEPVNPSETSQSSQSSKQMVMFTNQSAFVEEEIVNL